MPNIISPEEEFTTSYVHIGYLILKQINEQNSNKISMFDTISSLRKELNMVHYRQFIFGIMFLYSLGLIDFKAPYIIKI